jgi:chorismate synthase
MIQADLDRRRPGQSKVSTQRKEEDRVQILSGVFEGKTMGTPIAMLVQNKDARSKDYAKMRDLYRPSHGDYTYETKFGRRDPRGGGRASARETVSRVAAGGLARILLRELAGVKVTAWVQSVADINAIVDPETVTRELVDQTPVRCPDLEAADRMERRINTAKKELDTLGGVVRLAVHNVPAGWGSPVFSKLDAALAAGMLSIPAAKGFDLGSGFEGTLMRGSEHNDPFFVDNDGAVRTRTNHSGGVQAGISNGMPIILRVAFKPVATHFQQQETINKDGEATLFSAKGRHDPCVLPRAVPIVEAMALLALADAALGARLSRLEPASDPDSA